MDQHSMNEESCDTGSLPYSMTDSDAGSLAESIGSFQIDSRETASKPGASFPRPRKGKKGGPMFLQFSKQFRDVSVSAAWEYFRDHRSVAILARDKGVIAYFDYLEGDGAAGSVYIANYATKYTTHERYLIQKVEVRDDNSRMYAVRCVGGRYQQRYHLYFMFMKVIPHEVLGESSSTIIWRLQYESRDPSMPVPWETKASYLAALDNVEDRHLSMYRVQRPPVSHAMSATMTKRLKVLRCRQARQQQLGCDEQKPEDLSEQKRMSSVELVEIDETRNDDQDGHNLEQSLRGMMSGQSLGKDQGEIDRDDATIHIPRRRTRSQSLVDDEEGIDGVGLKRQRQSRSGVIGQLTQCMRKSGSISKNS